MKYIATKVRVPGLGLPQYLLAELSGWQQWTEDKDTRYSLRGEEIDKLRTLGAWVVILLSEVPEGTRIFRTLWVDS